MMEDKNFESRVSHNDDKKDPSMSNCEKGGQPQGEEGNPNQCIKTSAGKMDTNLDRRAGDELKGVDPDHTSQDASAVAGIQDDQQNAAGSDSNPTGQA